MVQECLVLNSGFTPLRVVSDREAITLLYQNKGYYSKDGINFVPIINNDE